LLGARLRLHRKPQKEIAAEIKARLKQKKSTQPLALASAGFVWKNPPFDQAGKLLEKAGCKGKRVGGAEISAKHPNFIVNRGGATATDILALMDLAFERVFKQTGIRLQPELRILGD
jgi:UDP-N-acetylmuramate dehydrogenase